MLCFLFAFTRSDDEVMNLKYSINMAKIRISLRIVPCGS